MTCATEQAQESPRVLVDNGLERAGSLTASSEDSENPAENAVQWLADDWWSPETGGTVTLTAQYAENETFSALCFGGHDLPLVGASYALEYSDNGSTWNTAIGSTSVSEYGVIYRPFTAVAATYWRITITCTAPFQLSMIGLGAEIELYRGVWTGYSSPLLSRMTKTSNQRAPGPNFLGRIREAEVGGDSLGIEYTTEEWARGAWSTIQSLVQQAPFWLLWSPDSYPEEAAYCWLDGSVGNAEIVDKAPWFSMDLPYMCMTRIFTESTSERAIAAGIAYAETATGAGTAAFEPSAFGGAEAEEAEGTGAQQFVPSYAFVTSYNSQYLGTL